MKPPEPLRVSYCSLLMLLARAAISMQAFLFIHLRQSFSSVWTATGLHDRQRCTHFRRSLRPRYQL